MKISLGDLRRLIRENIGVVPQWEPDDPRWEELFYSELKKFTGGGDLQVTHESPLDNKESIEKTGLDTDRLYFTIGWYDSPRFVSGPTVMYQCIIPGLYLDNESVFPDDRFGMGPEGCYNFITEEPVGGFEGKEISVSLTSSGFSKFPKNWIKEIIEV